MDRTLSWLAGADRAEALERTLTEIDAAITMVASGIARSVRLCNLPAAEEAAFDGAARAQAADVVFSLQRVGTKSVTMVFGPRVDDRSRTGRRPVDGGDAVPQAPP